MRSGRRVLAFVALLPIALGGCVVAADVGPPVVTGYGYYGPAYPRPYVYRPAPYGYWGPRYRPHYGRPWGYGRPYGYGHGRRW